MLNKKTLSVATALLLLNVVNLNSAPFKPVLTAKDADLTDIKPNPVVKVGNEYEIAGVKYKPKAVDSYDVVGIASWYGDQFHGKLTANGEVFDMNELTAASPDLPMPAFVEVTNLDNGKKIIVRVNDRGPFAGGRVLDLSKRSAELLGFQNQGTARVRVVLLKNITDQAVKDLNEQNAKKALAEAKLLEANGNNGAGSVTVAPASEAIATSPASEAIATAPAQASVSVIPAQATQEEALESKLVEPVVSNAFPPASVVKTVTSADLKENKEAEILSASDDANMQNINLAEPNPVKSYVPRGVFVQIGAFNSNNTSVEKKVGSLSQVGVVSLQKVDIAGKDVLRLRVGPYGSVDDAISIKNKLVKLGYQDSRVVVEE
jgi:rare lipoprotein A